MHACAWEWCAGLTWDDLPVLAFYCKQVSATFAHADLGAARAAAASAAPSGTRRARNRLLA
jgi:hypothetical protein